MKIKHPILANVIKTKDGIQYVYDSEKWTYDIDEAASIFKQKMEEFKTAEGITDDNMTMEVDSQ